MDRDHHTKELSSAKAMPKCKGEEKRMNKLDHQPATNRRKQTAASMALGIGIGLTLGAALGNIAAGVAIGIILGAVGIAFRTKRLG